MKPIIELSGVSRIYRMGSVSVNAVKELSLVVEAGEFVAIMGHSGSGKSTLLNILGFLDRPDSGSYMLNGIEVSGFTDDELSHLRNRTAGFIFQQFHLLPRMTVAENTELPLLYAPASSRDREQALRRISDVGLDHRIGHTPAELSGGEQQRVAIARSMVNDPIILFADEPTGNLDSKNEKEILAILKDLNERGKTIIMVTHEMDIAGQAGRIITMRDGYIISDKKTGKTRAGASPAATELVFEKDHAVTLSGIYSYFRQAVILLLSHKLRSFLSILGILIGVASVISMMAIGKGAQDSIEERLSSLGSNVLSIRPGSPKSRGVSLETGSVTRFTISDADAIGKLPEISGASGTVFGRAQAVYGNKNWNTTVQGVSPVYSEIRSSKTIAGAYFTDNDVRLRNKVAVIGITIVRELFNNQNPIGRTIKINRVNFTVVGVLKEMGSSHRFDRDDAIIIPITTAMYRLMGKDHIDSIDAQVKSPQLIDTAKESIKKTIINRHRLRPEDEESFEIFDMAEIREAVSGTARTIGLLLGFVALISLVVGGIGIMNIMLVTVKERTREIGLRKAVGARRRDILVQFLIESVLLTSVGGAAGILTGASFSYMLGHFAQWPVTISLSSVTLSTVFSVIVGIVFGLWPAIVASRLKPVEALRYE